MGLFRSAIGKVRAALGRTRDTFVGGLRSILSGRVLDDALMDEIESRLIQADLGVQTVANLMEGLRSAYKAGALKRSEDVIPHIKARLIGLWPEADRRIHFSTSGPTVILVGGVNGAGKTTSIAKLAKAMRDEGKTVLLAACDTFRAAAVEQLEIWSQRLGVEIVKGQQGGDPAAVAFDAAAAAVSRGVDVLIIDTAGRLQTQKHLMDQLAKIKRVVQKQIPDAPHESILVLDATTGQNAVRQAEEFSAAMELTGVFLSKLDGTAKGGVVVAIREKLSIPVKFIGVGETPDDVEPFEPEKFVEALFAE